MTDITAKCLCGATEVVASGPVKFAIRCYCTDCQRSTGAGHATQVAVPVAGVTVSGPRKFHTAKADSGNDLRFGFCGTCGAQMTKTTTRAPELLFLYAGTLDDPSVIPDKQNPVFESSRQAWDV